MPREIGLLGATTIAARAVVEPARRLSDVRVRGVAASDPGRAEAFRATHDLPLAYPTYRALLADDRIDVVYVSLHNSAHAQWAAAAASAGKHVVVEKPLCLGRRELHGIHHAAAAAGVHVVEAVMTARHPWQDAVRDIVAAGELGTLVEVRSHIAFEVPDRAGYRFRPELGGGALHDTASYWLDALQGTVGLDKAAGTGRAAFDGPHGVDLSFTASLEWPNGLRADLHAALTGPYRADHEFRCTAGRVRLRNFLRPAAGPFPLNLVITPEHGARRVLSFPAQAYYERQLDRVMAWLDSPEDPDPGVTQRIALMETAYQDALGVHLGW
ncbi:Gfo/Idh/MocA family protein [Actinophytocola sp.]|uniref:Gfo/Idh/MocA family protein n=1 Tax=Actinophytocola sp. TaxID=1872138 RepID=UPI0038998A1C